MEGQDAKKDAVLKEDNVVQQILSEISKLAAEVHTLVAAKAPAPAPVAPAAPAVPEQKSETASAMSEEGQDIANNAQVKLPKPTAVITTEGIGKKPEEGKDGVNFDEKKALIETVKAEVLKSLKVEKSGFPTRPDAGTMDFSRSTESRLPELSEISEMLEATKTGKPVDWSKVNKAVMNIKRREQAAMLGVGA